MATGSNETVANNTDVLMATRAFAPVANNTDVLPKKGGTKPSRTKGKDGRARAAKTSKEVIIKAWRCIDLPLGRYLGIQSRGLVGGLFCGGPHNNCRTINQPRANARHIWDLFERYWQDPNAQRCGRDPPGAVNQSLAGL